MKTTLGSNLIRGILIAFFAYQCWWWAHSLWGDLAARNPVYIVVSSLFLALFLVLGLGLWLHPARYARAAFVLLVLVVAGEVLIGWWIFPSLHVHRASFFVVHMVGELFVTLLVAVLAFVYQQRLHSAHLPA